MNTSTCPRCCEVFRVPDVDVPVDATAQCPWCGEIFPAKVLVEKLPPMVELLSAQGQPLFYNSAGLPADSASPSIGDFAADDDVDVEETWTDDSEGTVEDIDEVVENEPASTFYDDPSPQPDHSQSLQDESLESSDRDEWNLSVEDRDNEPHVPVAPMKVKAAPAPVRKKKSSLRTMVGVALGPLIAIPLAGGILLAWGRAPDLGFWPFDGSFNKSAAVNRTIGPASPPPSPATRANGNVGANGLADDIAAIAGEADASSSAALLGDADVSTNELASSDVEAADSAEEMVLPGSFLKPSLEAGEGLDEVDYADLDAVEQDAVEQDAAMMIAPSLDAEPLSVPSGVETEEVDTPSELQQTVATANDSLARLMKFQGSEVDRRKLLAKAYSAVAAVAAQPDATGDDSAKQMLRNLARSPLVDYLGDAADLWLDLPAGKRPDEGALLVGVPETEGGNSILRIRARAGGDREVIVSGVEMPTADKVLAIGRILSTSGETRVELVAAEAVK